MEFKKDINTEDDDAISLRDLQMYDNTATSSTRSSPRASSGQELFEFFPNLCNPSATRDIVFCGKLINPTSADESGNDDSQKLVGSSSFRLPDRAIDHVIPKRSVSNRDLGSPRFGVTSVKKANVATLTSTTSSSKSKRRMFMFAPVKFAQKMEMSAIRERQGRLAPSRMFPVAEGGGEGNVVTGTQKNQMIRCRARLNSAFERSLACLRP